MPHQELLKRDCSRLVSQILNIIISKAPISRFLIQAVKYQPLRLKCDMGAFGLSKEDIMTITVINKETKELIASVSEKDIIVKDGYEVLVDNDLDAESVIKELKTSIDSAIHDIAQAD